MKICWDNLNNIRLNISGNFIKKSDLYVEEDSCLYCEEPYLRLKSRKQMFCSKSCSKMRHAVSEKQKNKMRNTIKLKGNNVGKKNPMYGKKHSNKTKQKISNSLKKYSGKNSWNYGKNLSDITKIKISKTKKGTGVGEDNPNWKGGISFEPCCQIWSDKEYKESIKERDNYRCQNPYCTCYNIKRLVVHHINYDKKDCRPVNLITLCVSCNSTANKDRDWHTGWYKAIINKRYKEVL